MIHSLSIKNIVLIEDITINFKSGLNIISGETGTGKSILLNSISFILGDKINVDMIRKGTNKAVIQIIFELSDKYNVQNILSDMGIDFTDNELIIRREIFIEGKSRSYINSILVTNKNLKTIGELLLDISSQHSHQSLMKTKNHIDLLDNFSKITTQLNNLKQKFNDYKKLKFQLNELILSEEEKNKQIEIYQFAIEEIKNANLNINEDKELEFELNKLSYFETLSKTIETVYELLYQKDYSIISLSEKAIQNLENILKLDKNLVKAFKDIEEALYLMENAKDFLRNYKNKLNYYPDKIENINQRLDFILKLKNKYGNSITKIINYQKKCIQQLENLEKNKEKIKILKEKTKKLEKDLSKLAIQISSERHLKALELSKIIQKELSYLAMEKAKFKINFNYKESSDGFIKIKNGKIVELNSKGIDKIEFLFSANIGESLKPLHKIASGGELSRFMLALKSILSNMDNIETLLFDEVDTGIGGEIIFKIAEKIKNIAQKRQIICITHSPQIASQSDHHYLVEKYEKNNRTKTFIKELNLIEKTNEIAKMLGGKKINKISLEHAKQLINRTREV